MDGTGLFLEVLQGVQGVVRCLDFIEDHKVTPRSDRLPLVERQIPEDAFRVQIPGEKTVEFGLPLEVEIMDTFVLFSTKLLQNICLARLAGPSED